MALCNSLVGGINSSKWASWNVSPHLQTSTRPLLVDSGKYVVRYQTPTTDSIYSNLTTTMSSDLNNECMHVYDTLKFELVHDQAFVSDDDSRQWVEQMIDYNVPGGKMVRAFSVVDSCQLMKGEKMTEDEVFLACALGWCTEWLQASFVVLDDIMDGSITRRGRSCWYKLPAVGMTAVNDGLMLRNHVHRILKKHFHEKDYYVQLVDLFNEAEFQTVCGEMIDIIATIGGKKDISKYTMHLNRRIFEYKSSYYSFYLPIACALLLFGDNLDHHVLAKDVLIEMGIYYQVQNDYLDTYGDPNIFGKTGTDIEECKCSWLIVKALELANDEQKKVLSENYGMADPDKVAKVKEVYQTLKLKDVYEAYESNLYVELTKSIEAHPSKAVQGVLKSFLEKIYKGHK